MMLSRDYISSETLYENYQPCLLQFNINAILYKKKNKLNTTETSVIRKWFHSVVTYEFIGSDSYIISDGTMAAILN